MTPVADQFGIQCFIPTGTGWPMNEQGPSKAIGILERIMAVVPTDRNISSVSSRGGGGGEDIKSQNIGSCPLFGPFNSKRGCLHTRCGHIA